MRLATAKLICPQLGWSYRTRRRKQEADSGARLRLDCKPYEFPRTSPQNTDRSKRGIPMFNSAATHKHDWRTGERRSCQRKPLQWAVLVFFGDNWGKLVDLSERGMSFQFDHAPSLNAPIHFTFEAMGCMPFPQDARILGDSVQATGQVVWFLEFERMA